MNASSSRSTCIKSGCSCVWGRRSDNTHYHLSIYASRLPSVVAQSDRSSFVWVAAALPPLTAGASPSGVTGASRTWIDAVLSPGITRPPTPGIIEASASYDVAGVLSLGAVTASLTRVDEVTLREITGSSSSNTQS